MTGACTACVSTVPSVQTWSTATDPSMPAVQHLFASNLSSVAWVMNGLTQMSQTAACNRHHSLEAQLCKRLLLNLDRLSSSAMMMTQELMANILGVRREGARRLAWPVGSRPRQPVAGAEAFLAMSALVSGAWTDAAILAG